MSSRKHCWLPYSTPSQQLKCLSQIQAVLDTIITRFAAARIVWYWLGWFIPGVWVHLIGNLGLYFPSQWFWSLPWASDAPMLAWGTRCWKSCKLWKAPQKYNWSNSGRLSIFSLIWKSGHGLIHFTLDLQATLTGTWLCVMEWKLFEWVGSREALTKVQLITLLNRDHRQIDKQKDRQTKVGHQTTRGRKNRNNNLRTIPRNPEISGKFANYPQAYRIGWINGHQIRCILRHPPCIATNVTDVRLMCFTRTIRKQARE